MGAAHIAIVGHGNIGEAQWGALGLHEQQEIVPHEPGKKHGLLPQHAAKVVNIRADMPQAIG